jgi:nitroreductase
MDIHEIIRTRRSVRAYQDRPIPDEVLTRVLDAARMAPSARNIQPWKFVVVKDPGIRADLAVAANGQTFVGQAPVVIVAVGLEPDRMMGCGVPPYAVDVAIAVDHMTLAATAEGLGSCWIGAYSQEDVRSILSIPDSHKVVVLLPVGYPADTPEEKQRKPLPEIVSEDRFE